MSNLIYIVFAVMMGAAISTQPPINASMARVLGSPLLAATVSIAISLGLVLALWFSWGKSGGDIAAVRSLPWWAVVGGVVGALFVAGSLVAAPVLGVALFFVCVLVGQLLGSSVIDQTGAFGLDVKPMNPMKLIGIFLVVVGAVLVQHSNNGA